MRKFTYGPAAVAVMPGSLPESVAASSAATAGGAALRSFATTKQGKARSPSLGSRGRSSLSALADTPVAPASAARMGSEKICIAITPHNRSERPGA
jgi:hypothetical protein